MSEQQASSDDEEMVESYIMPEADPTLAARNALAVEALKGLPPGAVIHVYGKTTNKMVVESGEDSRFEESELLIDCRCDE